MKKIMLCLLLVVNLFAGDYIVKKVTDGDTIQVLKKGTIDIKSNYLKIRLAFIDTMESTRNNRAKKMAEKCNLDINKMVEIGIMSKEYLTNILLNKEIDIIIYGKDTLDKRYVGEIYLNPIKDSINTIMILNGNALPYYKFIRKMEPEDLDFYIYSFKIGKHDSYLNNECLHKELGK